MKIYLKLACLLAALALSGCANPKQIMVNPNTWQQYNCSAHGYGAIGSAQAVSMMEKCMSNQRVLGNIPLEEAELKEPPVFTGPANMTQTQADKPVWFAGYSWDYAVNGSPSKIAVEKVDTHKGSKAYIIKTGNESRILNESLGLAAVMKNNMLDISYDPALQPFDWPLFVGKTWNPTGKMLRNGGEMKLSTHYEVKGFGKIKVAAGEFEAFYIMARSDYGARISEIWYSPSIKYYVKAVTYTENGKIVDELKSYNLK